MAQIPFNVSARTALLIGRENIANSKGAVIELVKNCYDADSFFSLIILNTLYEDAPKTLTISEFNELFHQDLISYKNLTTFYKKQEDRYVLKEDLENNAIEIVRKLFLDLNSIYIIDNGDGMTQEIIKENWMTIGTDNKLQDDTTRRNRIKSGAKGIGRFALDKLGRQCELVSIANPNVHQIHSNKDNSVYWSVDWSKFEQNNVTINEVNAILETFRSQNIYHSFNILSCNTNLDLLDITKNINRLALSKIKFWDETAPHHGTIIKISHLHDVWTQESIKTLYEDLEVLVPPRDIEEYTIHILSLQDLNKYGEILSSLCDDFDYKLVAKANHKQEVEVTIYREEYNEKIIPKEFFDRETLDKETFIENNELKKEFSQILTFKELLPGFENERVLEQIGSFEFIFYYLKRSATTTDRKRFYYKYFETADRKKWLEQFGGIKLYRDNFRVRPYGETGEPAFDWLGLGTRKASSPAGISKKEGGYRVEPENVAGIVKISRVNNFAFQDKSSREGLQETTALKTFKLLLTSIISKLESDRSSLAKEFESYYSEKYGHIRDREKAIKLAESITSRKREEAEKQDSNQTQNSNSQEQTKSATEEVLAQEIMDQKNEINELATELNILRALASSGIMAAAFSHDYGKIHDDLNTRTERFRQSLEKLITKDLNDVPSYKNPFRLLENMQRTDQKIATWLAFSLGFTKKDKRKRKKVQINDYIKNLANDWLSTFDEGGITLEYDCEDSLYAKVFEVDLDSIFINLFTNSIYALELPSNRTTPNKISIKIKGIGRIINIIYEDNGPGIPKELKDPNIILEPKFTTKRNQVTGEEVGTGLGMWIIKKIIDEHKGDVNILSHSSEGGFGISLTIPRIINSEIEL